MGDAAGRPPAVTEGMSRDSGIEEPAGRAGVGFLLEGASDLTIRAAHFRGFRHNLVLRGCRNVLIDGGEFSQSHRAELYSKDAYDERDWLDIFDESVWRQYGAGIVLEDCEACVVSGARAGAAQNGLMLINSRGCLISGCDFSRNSGWGIWMWGSHGNTVTGNNCEWCVRCEDPERFSAGGDSAGIMLSHDNCHNVFTHNNIRFGGDGFFLNGLRVAPSEHNLVAFNDASHSPHNAFESSWSGYNRFVGNIASNSRFGFWCGYSHHNEFAGNVVENCLQWGIAIEHGCANRILGNELRRNGRGIVLFRRDPDAQESRDYLIAGNVVDGGESAVTLSETSAVTLAENSLAADTALELKRSAAGIRVLGGSLRGIHAVTAEEGCSVEIAGAEIEGALGGPVKVIAAPSGLRADHALGVRAQPADPAQREDWEFRWYDPRKSAGTLVGTAEL